MYTELDVTDTNIYIYTDTNIYMHMAYIQKHRWVCKRIQALLSLTPSPCLSLLLCFSR